MTWREHDAGHQGLPRTADRAGRPDGLRPRGPDPPESAAASEADAARATGSTLSAAAPKAGTGRREASPPAIDHQRQPPSPPREGASEFTRPLRRGMVSWTTTVHGEQAQRGKTA